jgi:hypothetical protein
MFMFSWSRAQSPVPRVDAIYMDIQDDEAFPASVAAERDSDRRATFNNNMSGQLNVNVGTAVALNLDDENSCRLVAALSYPLTAQSCAYYQPQSVSKQPQSLREQSVCTLANTDAPLACDMHV